jgi:hypothetical protein
MSDQNPRTMRRYNPGFLQEILTRGKLVLRLMGDRRVNPFIKIIPVGTILYLVVPDLLPGPIDDLTIIGLGCYLFVELCPPDVVHEHMQNLQSVISGSWTAAAGAAGAEQKDSAAEEVVDAEFREVPAGEKDHSNR